MRYYMSFQILGTGSFLPQRVVTNEDLSQMVETSDQWITQRVGVKTRHVCTSETALDLGAEAARRAAGFVRECIAAAVQEGGDPLLGVPFEGKLRQLWEPPDV